jgi:hypothetical protein
MSSILAKTRGLSSKWIKTISFSPVINEKSSKINKYEKSTKFEKMTENTNGSHQSYPFGF